MKMTTPNENYRLSLFYSHSVSVFLCHIYHLQISFAMKTLERLFAEKLLKIKAIKLQPANPFTWASGWKSPFYCDNRKTLSYPSLRNFVKIEITRLILERFGQVDACLLYTSGIPARTTFSTPLPVLVWVVDMFSVGNPAGTSSRVRSVSYTHLRGTG